MSNEDAVPLAYRQDAPEFMEEPNAFYDQLSSRCPVHFTQEMEVPLYTLTRRDDVVGALRAPNLWVNRFGPGLGYASGTGGVYSSADDPEHAFHRRLIQPYFSQSAVARMEPMVRAAAHQKIDAVVEARSCDLSADYAMKIPIAVLVDLLGIRLTEEQERDLAVAADVLVLSLIYPSKGNQEFPVLKELFASIQQDIIRYREMDDAGADIPYGLVGHLATVKVEGERIDLQLATTLAHGLLLPGFETTVNLITNCVWRLLQDRPNRWLRIVDDPTLIPTAVEESLRFDPPVMGDCRVNVENVSLHGTTIPAGSKVMMLYGPSNYDPQVFDNPHEFRVDRPLPESTKHLSFATGIHFCVGAHLARMESRVAIEVLTERLPTLELAGETERVESPFLWGRASLPVSW